MSSPLRVILQRTYKNHVVYLLRGNYSIHLFHYPRNQMKQNSFCRQNDCSSQHHSHINTINERTGSKTKTQSSLPPAANNRSVLWGKCRRLAVSIQVGHRAVSSKGIWGFTANDTFTKERNKERFNGRMKENVRSKEGNGEWKE